MSQSCENELHLEQWVKLDKIGHIWRNWSHVIKWVTFIEKDCCKMATLRIS